MKKSLFLFVCLFNFIIPFSTFAQNWKLSKDIKKFPDNYYYKLYELKDTLYAGENYKAYIEIDTTKIKDINKISVFFEHNSPLRLYKNKFELEFITAFEGPFECELTIYNSELKPYTTTNIKHTIYVIRPLKPKPPMDYVVVPEKYPVFNSATYKDFTDYLTQSFKKENIKARGKVFIDYTVMKDGSMRFEQIKGYSFEDRDKIEKIVTGFKDWIPGEDGGKKVNVYVSAICNFR